MADRSVSARSTLGQVLPPLALFLPLLVSDPTQLAVLLAAVVLVLAASLARLGWLAVRRPAPGTRMLGSVLAVVFAGGVLALTWLEIAPVARYVNGLAAGVHAQCRNLGKCPQRIGGWRDAGGGSDQTVGGRVRYDLAYRTDGTDFRVCWRVAFDRCRSATGGANAALGPVSALPWPQVGAGGQPP